jgi:hypothetical protein
MSDDKEWAINNAEAFVFNTPGLDEPTAKSLDEAVGLYHIRNKGKIAVVGFRLVNIIKMSP